MIHEASGRNTRTLDVPNRANERKIRMKNTRWFRFTASLLALVMVLTASPFSVLAEGENGDNTPNDQTTVTGVYDGEIVFSDAAETFDISNTAITEFVDQNGNSVAATAMDPNKNNQLKISVSGLDADKQISKDTKLVLQIPAGIQIPAVFAEALSSDQVTGGLDSNGNLTLSFKGEKTDAVSATVSVLPHMPADNDLSGTYLLGTAGNQNYKVLLGYTPFDEGDGRGRLKGYEFQDDNGTIHTKSNVSPFWKLTHVTGNYYTVYSVNAGQYLRINDSNNGIYLDSVDEASAQKILVLSVGNGYYQFSYNKKSVNNSSFKAERGFASYQDSDKGNNAILKLYSTSAISNEATVDVAGTWIVMSGNNVILGGNSSSGRINGVSTEKIGEKFMPLGQEAAWTFEHVIRDWYNVRTNNGYLNISSSGVSISSQPQNLLVSKSGNQIMLLENENGAALGLSGTEYINTAKGSAAKLTLREQGSLLGHSVLTFDANGGQATVPNAISGEPGETITLPAMQGSKNGGEFIGWCIKQNFYAKANNETSTYHILLRPGDSYTLTATGKSKLYAVYNTTKTDVRFGVRMDGIIQDEPNTFNTSDYKGHFWMYGVRISNTWVIDVNSNKSVNGYYVENNVTAALTTVPSAEQIKKALKNEGNINFDPETQYIHWYVFKYTGSEWHVDGVIRDKTKVEITYDTNIADVDEKAAVLPTMPGGYQVAVGTGIQIGTNKNSSEIKTPEREGYVFKGWNTKADGSGTSYNEGAYVTLKENLHLFAQWVKKVDMVIYITSDWPAGKPAYEGTPITLTANLSGFEGKTYTLQWQYSTDLENWTDAVNANEVTFTYIMDATTATYTWRVIARNVR